MTQLAADADVPEVREAILGNRFIRISEQDAGRVAEWAIDMNRSGWTSRRNLLVIGRTGSGKSVLIHVLWPLFKAPANGIAGPWRKLKEISAEPMIIDHTRLGLGDKREAELVDGLNGCAGPLLVTSFSDLAGLKGEWIRVTLDRREDDHSTDFGNPTTLVNQAGPTAGQYLSEAVDKIDEVFGKGYARKHPELVGMFMQVAAGLRKRSLM
jgi:hypothetical protein